MPPTSASPASQPYPATTPSSPDRAEAEAGAGGGVQATTSDGGTAVADLSGLSPREIRRLQRIKVGREQILDAAEELFGRYGYRGTSLQQVAKRCEFSIGALYLFIDSKEELLRSVLERRRVALMQEIRECIAVEGPAHDVLVQLAQAKVAFHRRYPDFGRLSMRIISAGMETVPGFDQDVAEGYDRAIDIEAELVARGQADGSIRSGDSRSLARLFSAMVSAYHALDPVVSPDGADHLADQDFLDCVSRAFAAGGHTCG